MQNLLLYNEKHVLLKLSKGDEKAFEAIYNEYQPKLFLYIFPFTNRSKELTEEIIQNVFVKLWIRRETLIAIENFPKYFFRMARNQFLDMKLKIKKEAIITNEIPEKDHELRSPIIERIALKEYSEVAKWAVNSLSPQRKKIFLLRYEGDFSIDEIADSLKISKNSVKKQLYEGVNFIKGYLKKHSQFPTILVFLLLENH